jgi:hypothetical protein
MKNCTRAAEPVFYRGDIWWGWTPQPGEILFKMGDIVRQRTYDEDTAFGRIPPIINGVVLENYSFNPKNNKEIKVLFEGFDRKVDVRTLVMVKKRNEEDIARFEGYYSVGKEREKIAIDIHRSQLANKSPAEREYLVNHYFRTEGERRMENKIVIEWEEVGEMGKSKPR